MQAIIKPRKIADRIDSSTGENRRYLEFEYDFPAQIDRINITNAPPAFQDVFSQSLGEELLVAIEFREFKGRPFTALNAEFMPVPYQAPTLASVSPLKSDQPESPLTRVDKPEATKKAAS